MVFRSTRLLMDIVSVPSTMDSDKHYDIIIVGGGPAGSACGALLAREGLSVLICEKTKFPRDKICGECINPRSWSFFELLGVADELRALSLNRIESLRITNSRGASIGALIPINPDCPFFSIARSQLDSMLLNRARESGATIFEEAVVINFRWDTSWHVVVRDCKTDNKRSFTAGFLVGADGRNSLVARWLGTGRSSNDSSRRVGVQWHTAHQPQVSSAVEMFHFNSGYGGVVNIDAHRANVALVTRPEIAQLVSKDLSLFLSKTIYSNSSARLRIESLHPTGGFLTAYPISPKIHQSFHPHASLIGDAHQSVEPFTGEGIFFALQDACRVASFIGRHFGKQLTFNSSSPRNRFPTNRIVSPTLRHPRVADTAISIGSYFHHLAAVSIRSFLQ